MNVPPTRKARREGSTADSREDTGGSDHGLGSLLLLLLGLALPALGRAGSGAAAAELSTSAAGGALVSGWEGSAAPWPPWPPAWAAA